MTNAEHAAMIMRAVIDYGDAKFEEGQAEHDERASHRRVTRLSEQTLQRYTRVSQLVNAFAHQDA